MICLVRSFVALSHAHLLHRLLASRGLLASREIASVSACVRVCALEAKLNLWWLTAP